MKKLYGVGVNDADYKTSRWVEGKEVWRCPFYRTWTGVLRRCVSEVFKKKHPTYVDCEICPEWLFFSNFKAWMETQDWEGKHLDKDLIVKRNKKYSPETCAFVSQETNNLLVESFSARGEWPVGVHWSKAAEKFTAQICMGRGKVKYLGLYSSPEQAHARWREEKQKLALQMAEQESDVRVKRALENWYKED